MAVDDRKSARRWGFKSGETVKAEKKERGAAVKPIPKVSSGNARTDATKLLERRALERIIQGLPTHQRTQWPAGNSDFTALSSGSVRFNVRLSHKSGFTIQEYINIPEYAIEEANLDKINELADSLADRIIYEIRKYHDSDSSKGDARSAPPTPPPDFTAQKQAQMKPKPKVGTAGPFCIICGPEDRTKYPDWSTCPHNPEGLT